MTENRDRSSRRAFFLRGGAALGVGVGAAVTTTVGASSKDELSEMRWQLASAADQGAIRELHRAFVTLMEQQAYEAVAELFDEQAHLSLSGVRATGRHAIRELFADQYRDQNAAALHRAYRQNPLQPSDVVTLSEDRSQATGTFHVEVEVCTPLREDCTAAQMARLQGHVADRRWEAGRFEARYVKLKDQWKVASLSYRVSPVLM